MWNKQVFMHIHPQGMCPFQKKRYTQSGGDVEQALFLHEGPCVFQTVEMPFFSAAHFPTSCEKLHNQLILS